MSTATVDSALSVMVGERSDVPAVAADIIYEGSAVGDDGAGYGRPLTAGDVFRGHAYEKCDNASGAAGAKNVRVLTGRYRLEVALVGLITDVGRPVYMSDDTVYTFVAVSNSYVGVITRYVSATMMEIECRVGEVDEFGPNTSRVTKTDDYTTLDVDNGRIIYLGVNAKTITLIATVAGYKITVVNAGGFGVAGIILDFNAADKSLGGCGLAAGADGAAITNTKATAQRGDFITLIGDGTAGWNVAGLRGTWVQA